MQNKKTIGTHDDKHFISGFHRYLVGGAVIKSNSWSELIKTPILFEDEKWLNQLFNELKLLEYVTHIEHLLCCIFSYMHQAKRLKSNKKIREMIIRQTQKSRELTTLEAEELLKKETEDDFVRLLSPHILCYIAGMGLGELKHFLESQVVGYDKDDDFVKRLQQLKINRNEIVHNKLSSRIHLEELLKSSLDDAKIIYEILDKQMNEFVETFPANIITN